MTENAQYIIERIERAFANVRLEDGVSLHEADVIDDYGTDEQRRAARSDDEMTDWRKIPDELLARHDSCLAFFDAKGMRFHLPAYMRFTVRHFKTSDSFSIDSTIYALRQPDDERFSLFTASQRAAVRRFLKFMAFNASRHCDSHSAQRAVERWKGQ